MLLLLPLLTMSCLAVKGTEWCSGVERWEVGCSTCYCRAGVPYCYQGTCRRQGGSGGGCVSGSTWRRQCNLCFCDDGVPVCSYIPCPPSSATGGAREVAAAQVQRGAAAFWTPALVYQVGGREGCVAAAEAAAASRRADSPCTRCVCRHGVPLCTVSATCPPPSTTLAELSTGSRQTLPSPAASPSTVTHGSAVSTFHRRHTTASLLAGTAAASRPSEDRTAASLSFEDRTAASLPSEDRTAASLPSEDHIAASLPFEDRTATTTDY